MAARRAVLGAALAALAFAPALAQPMSAPQPLPMPAPRPAPRDIPYPGTMKLEVDATDLDRRILRVRQTIPVAQAGPMMLLYPEWLPGNHAPRGPIYNYAGLTIRAAGKPLAWARDPVEVYGFRVDVPRGVAELEIEAQFLTPTDASQGGAMMTPELIRLLWNVVGLYPAGYYVRQIPVAASVRLPAGWDFGTALETASRSGDVVAFKPVSFETLVDSPLLAGRYFKKIDLDPGGRSRVTLNIGADAPEYLEARPEIVARHLELVRQADKLYGARHYDHYDFLLSLSDRLAGSGLEHHRSSDNGTDAKYFTTWDTAFISRDLLGHEYNHSWNGKHRRPADLWTPDYSTPMRNSLLWVYEGQTQYYGNVLAARAGMVTKAQALDSLAETAAQYDYRVARAWRPLQDTAYDPIVMSRRSIPWLSWQRSEDYYREGQLIWLEVDTLIRQRSKNRRSLDDFAKAFFGMRDGDWGELTYQFDDVVAALNKVEPYDWATFLRRRLDETGAPPPLEGLARGGYRLVYTDTPTDWFKSNESRAKSVNLTYSIGLTADSGGRLTAVQWEGPAFKAGLAVGAQVVAVNGLAFDADRLKAAVRATAGGGKAVELLIRQGDLYRTVTLDYHDGLRYPRLEPIEGAEPLLDQILAPK